MGVMGVVTVMGVITVMGVSVGELTPSLGLNRVR